MGDISIPSTEAVGFERAALVAAPVPNTIRKLARQATALSVSLGLMVPATGFSAPSGGTTTPNDCYPSHPVGLTISDSQPSANGVDRLIIDATSCENVSGVDITEATSGGQNQTYTNQDLTAGQSVPFNFNVSTSGKNENSVQTISFKALSASGVILGNDQLTLEQDSTNISLLNVPTAIWPSVEDSCHPAVDFRYGPQDDTDFIFAHDISRNQAYNLASTVWKGANVIRFNFIYGQVEKYGLKPYEEAVNAALKHGYVIDATIMGTTNYEPTFNQALSYDHPNTKIMKQFANQIASLFKQKIAYYSIWNEPQNPQFLKQSKNMSSTMQTYNRLYLAGRAGVLAADPKAKLLAGQLSMTNIFAWIKDLNKLPEDGDALHSYGRIGYTYLFGQMAKAPIYITEFGIPAGTPDQLAEDQAAIKIARCERARQMILYQLTKRPAAWDTGVVNWPQPKAAVHSHTLDLHDYPLTKAGH